jgi:hypothetical protein
MEGSKTIGELFPTKLMLLCDYVLREWAIVPLSQ